MVGEKILRAQRRIEIEILQHGGVYPDNDGRLTEAEVCRRAGVAASVLQGIVDTSTIRTQLGVWLRKMDELSDEHAKSGTQPDRGKLG